MDDNYLKFELETLMRTDPKTWAFLQASSLDGVWFWDLEKPENEWISPEMWRLFGIDPATKRHDPAEWQDIIFQEDFVTALRNFEAHCADPDVRYDQIVRYRHADGSVVWVRCRGVAIRDAAGKAIRMLGVHNDLTAVKRSEQEARASARQAETANADFCTFAYSVSHDMKAPANTLKLLLSELDHLTSTKLEPDAANILKMSIQTVGRMQMLADDVLDYTRVIDTEPMFDRVDLSVCAHAALSNLQADIAAKGAIVNIEAMPDIDGDRMQLTTLFQNLLSNAVKFSTPKITPRIDVTCTHRPDIDSFNICVRDNGIGIPAKGQRRIFELFQRLHTRDIYAGTGIGLPLCQRIVLNHQGEISVTSQEGAGSVFTINLPRRLR